jgi:transposase-like protein
MLTVVAGGGSGRGDRSPSLIDEIVREGARRMLAGALQAGVGAYIAQFAAGRGGRGRRLVVRDGYHRSREVLTGAGAVEVTVPRVNDKRAGPAAGERRRFCSAIVPPWARRSPKITGVLPLLYRHGLSSGGFVPALGQFPGSAAGLPAAVITKLAGTWKAERCAVAGRDLPGVDCVYLRADGIHVNIRLEEHQPCLLVMIGVRAGGGRELIALAEGYRESAGSRADLLRGCARRGMRVPVPAVGGGALGFWGALREVSAQARQGRCWFRKTASVLAARPRPAHPGAKKALAEMWGAGDTDHALAAVTAFEAAYGAKFPGGPGWRAAGLAMAVTLIQSAQDRWRAVSASRLVALVRAGACVERGLLVGRPEAVAA